jgi:hypothetical protein
MNYMTMKVQLVRKSELDVARALVKEKPVAEV